MRKFMLITNRYKDRDLTLSNEIVSYIQQKGGSAAICVSNVEDDNQKDFALSEIPADTECILVLGGDGTLIRAATKVEALQIPLIGVNLGTLDVRQFNEDMTRLLAGEKVDMPSFNFKTGKREYRGRTLQLKENDILVIEGIHGLNDKLSYTLPAESKFKIYISALTQLNIDEHNPLSTTDCRRSTGSGISHDPT